MSVPEELFEIPETRAVGNGAGIASMHSVAAAHARRRSNISDGRQGSVDGSGSHAGGSDALVSGGQRRSGRTDGASEDEDARAPCGLSGRMESARRRSIESIRRSMEERRRR